jgi:translation initiation factor 1A
MSQKNKKKIANKNKIKKNTEKASKRKLEFTDDGQLYGKCTKVEGDRRFKILCSDGKTRTGKLRGKIRKRKKSWLSIGIWVIVALRDFQDEKCDIIHMFNERRR